MKKIGYHLIGILIWAFAFTKLFVFDIDLFLIEYYAMDYLWIHNYRFIFLLILVVISWFWLGNQDFLKFTSFILFYPIILLFWTIPVGLILKRKWFLVFTYVSGFISTVSNFKKNLIIVTVFLVCTSLIIQFENEYIIYISSFFLLLISLYIIYRKVYFTFSPSSIFAINTKKIVSWLEGNNLSENLLKESNSENKKNEDLEIENKVDDKDGVPEKLPILLLTNRTLFFVAEKLKRFKESRVYVVFFIISLLFTFIASVFLFSFINYGLYKLNHDAFTFTGPDGYFIFLFYSFNALIMNTISSVEPKSTLTMLINMIQGIYGILLIIVLIGIAISVNTQKYKDDIDQVIYAFNSQCEHVEQTLRFNFKLTVNQAIEELEKVKHGLIDIIKFIDPDQE